MRFDLVKILLVDDNPHMRVLITEILRAIGARHIYEASHGAEGLQMLRTYPIDIVMTDLAMQPIDGIDFTRLVRNSKDSPAPMVPIIMITGHSTLRRVAEARDAGVTEFLGKPITARGIIERLNRVVEHPRAFIRTPEYFGPCRRRRDDATFDGPYRRAADRNTQALDA